MINCYNTFDKINEIMLGDVDYGVIKFCDESYAEKLTHIFNKTKKELNQLQSLLESKGIKVYRPNLIKNSLIQTPYWTSSGIKIPLTPRDIFLIIGNNIIEIASWQKERMFETYYWREVLLDLQKKGNRWFSMPLPRHDYLDLKFKIDDDIPNQDPILDNPSILQFGKDIFVSGGHSHNQLGLTWLKNMFPEYRYHQLDKNIYKGHLDSHLTILRPGLLMTYHGRNDLPEFFKNWDIIYVDPSDDKKISNNQKLIDEKIQDDDFANTVLAVNLLSLDQNTILTYDHYKNNKYLMNQFDKHQIEVLFFDFTYSHFFNQGVTCLTRDLYRETPECIDYTT
jgi:glycine amidinotransferase